MTFVLRRVSLRDTAPGLLLGEFKEEPEIKPKAAKVSMLFNIAKFVVNHYKSVMSFLYY